MQESPSATIPPPDWTADSREGVRRGEPRPVTSLHRLAKLQYLDLIVGAVAAVWFGFVVSITRSGHLVPGDDAFISFQYARNLARGVGLVFNRGEHVWGFTSPLQTLLLGGLTALGFDTIRAAFLMAFFSVAAASVLLYGVATRVLPRAGALALSLFFLLSHQQHGNYGLESNLLVAVQTAFLVAVVLGHARAANCFGALACLVRADSLVLVVPILLAGRETRRPANLAWFIAPGLAWEAFAVAYYHDFLPNTYHAKAGLTGFWEFLPNAVTSMTTFRLPFTSAPLAATRIAIVALSVLALANKTMRRTPALAYGLVVYPWVLVLAYSWIGSFKGHNWEFYSAGFFLRVSALIGLLHIIGEAARRWTTGWVQRLVAFIVVVAIAAGGLGEVWRFFTNSRREDSSPNGGSRYRTYRRIAEWANFNIPPGSTIAMGEVGTFGYYANHRIVDTSGIVTRGYRPEERMETMDFVRRFEPSYVIWFGDRTDVTVEQNLIYRRIAYFPAEGFRDFSVMIHQQP